MDNRHLNQATQIMISHAHGSFAKWEMFTAVALSPTRRESAVTFLFCLCCFGVFASRRDVAVRSQ